MAASKPTRKFYGRRTGRPLNSTRKKALQHALPKYRFDLSIPPTDQFSPLHPKQLWLEIGFGNGEHLAEQAKAHPEIGMIGCEPFINGVAALMKQITEEKITNIRVWPDDARDVLDALPPVSLDRVFLLFADPWPKKRHHRRRFIQKETLNRLSYLMKDHAELRIATDFPSLAEWNLFHTLNHPDFEWLANQADDWRIRPRDWPPTRYEEKSIAHGAKPVYLRFLRTPRSG